MTTTLVNVLWNRAGLGEWNRCTNWSIRWMVPLFSSSSSSPFFLLHAPTSCLGPLHPQSQLLSTSNSRGNKNLIGCFLCSPLRIERPPLQARPERWPREGQSDTHTGVELTFSRSRYFFQPTRGRPRDLLVFSCKR